MRALIVVDMQNDFINGALGTNEAFAILPNVMNKIKEYEPDEIWVTKDTHHEDYLETNEGRHLPVEHCILGTEGYRLNPAIVGCLHGVRGDHVIIKPTFGSTELAERLKMAAEDDHPEIELVGLCTGICVLSNAILLKAVLPEAQITVDASCCACVTPESHDTALAAMKLCQIEITNEGKEPWRS